jgi:hypothetical protein
MQEHASVERSLGTPLRTICRFSNTYHYERSQITHPLRKTFENIAAQNTPPITTESL